MTNKSKKKSKKRASRRNNQGSNFPIFPDTQSFALKYSTRINYSSAALNVYNVGVSSLQTFQGFYRDQLLALYTNYVVLGFTARYKIVNTSTSGVSAEVLDFNCPSTLTSGMTLAQMLEWPSTRKHLITYLGNTSSIAFQKHYDLRNIYKKDISPDTDFWGTASSAPAYANPEDHCLAVYSTDGAATVTLLIDREYIFHVKFFRRANPGNSITSMPVIPYFPEKKKPKVVKPPVKVAVVVSDSD